MICIQELSRHYYVRLLDDSDAEDILNLCRENEQFYRYSAAEPAMEQVLNDLHITPPGISLSDKYYVGFYRDKELIAVMDLIDGYPEKDIAYIGFFMMKKELQGQGTGTEIIQEVSAYLKQHGKTMIRLGIDQGNPQSAHFWKKNGFHVTHGSERDGHKILAAEKEL